MGIISKSAIFAGLCIIAICGRAASGQTPYPLQHSAGFDPTSATLTQIATLNSSGSDVESYPVTAPGTSITQSASTTGATISHTFTNSEFGYNGSTTATGSVYQVTNASTMSMALGAGTGISQSNPSDEVYSGPSELDIHVDAVWQLTAGFPDGEEIPGIGYQYPIAGIVGLGGTDHFILNLNFYYYSNPDTPANKFAGTGTNVGSITVDHTYTNGTASSVSFSDLISGTALINDGGSLAAGGYFEMVGDIEFKAKDPDSPSSFGLTAESDFGEEDLLDAGLGFPSSGTVDDVATFVETPLPAPLAMGAVLMLLAAAGPLRRRIMG
jgi:hypothetical protein